MCAMKRAVHCIVLNEVPGSRTACPASNYIGLHTHNSANMIPIDVRSKPTCFKFHALSRHAG